VADIPAAAAAAGVAAAVDIDYDVVTHIHPIHGENCRCYYY